MYRGESPLYIGKFPNRLGEFPRVESNLPGVTSITNRDPQGPYSTAMNTGKITLCTGKMP